MKMYRQPIFSVKKPPILGAIMGATPITKITDDSIFAASVPLNLSRIIAKLATMPLLAPNACIKRMATKKGRLGEMAMQSEASK